MSPQAVLSPLFVEVILTFALMLGMAVLRGADFRSGAVKASDVALREPNWPKRTTQMANAFSNQFELPVLFYVLTILAWATRQAGVVFVFLAWLFVIFRLGQAAVHVSSNVVKLRGAFFLASAVVLMAMWAIYIIAVFSSGVA
jgi:hypothetical protein